MTIPLLSNARLGYSWLETDGTTGTIPFEANHMVLGEGTRAFTLADTVGFGIKTALPIPLLIESDKLMCLSSTGATLNSREICTKFGQYVGASIQTETICGKNYVILGRGDYQKAANCSGPMTYIPKQANSANSITLFRGSDLYDIYPTRLQRISLSNAFFGQTPSNDTGALILSNGSVTMNPASVIPLVALDVKVSTARV